MSKRVLAISWDMPPLSGPRAVQVSRTLTQLVPLGWESTVVCFGPRSQRYQQDPELASRLLPPSGVTLVRLPSLEERWPFRALWRLVPPIKQLPDEKRVWIAPASRVARQLAADRSFDVLVSFAQPWSDHLIGLRVHRATGLPWVAHFSDPWVDSPYLRGRRWQQRIWRRMESDVIRHATAVVFVNSHTADRVMQKYPDAWRAKVHVVPHGFDSASGRTAAPADAAGPLHLVHTGRFYEGIRTPEPLIRALATLARRRALASDLRVTFAGTPVPAYQRLADRLGLGGVIVFRGRVPFSESARIAASADVVMVIDAPADNNLFLPSKLIDYLPLNKPILGLTPHTGATADLLRALDQPVVEPDDEAGIAAAIEALIERKQRGRLVVPATYQAVAAQYDSRATTRVFADILERCA
ncbi:MAG: glycosyltransferase [Vicinamibacterales bacterium]